MGTLNEDLTAIKTVEDTLTSNKVARLCYTDTAYNNNDANGVTEYNVNHEQNIPVATASAMKVNDTVLSKGYRSQASSVTRMLLNHFLGRLSYNVNKVNDNMSNLLSTLISHRGTANGLATLDADGRIPYSQLPESAVELKGYWNADTNTPTLADGTGDDGDEYYVDVAGSQDLGSGTQYFNVGDRVLYIDGVRKNINSTAVKSVNSVLPSAQGNVALPTKVISLDNTLTVTGAPALSVGDTIKALFTANITGTDDTTGMSISYNGTSYPVKVPKEGALSDFVATELTTGNFTYIDAYKYVEFMLNGNDELVIIGNPLVLSGEDYEVYADGKVGNEPVGTVRALTTVNVPYGWAVGDHSAISRTKHYKLFNKYNTEEVEISGVATKLINIYGTGDGSTTFNIPDLRESVLVGTGQNDSDTIASHDVYTVGQFKDDCVQNHAHTINSYQEYSIGGNMRGFDYLTNVTGAQNYTKGIETSSARIGLVTRTKQKGVTYIVKVL
jgi:microcystin-dependent protein